MDTDAVLDAYETNGWAGVTTLEDAQCVTLETGDFPVFNPDSPLFAAVTAVTVPNAELPSLVYLTDLSSPPVDPDDVPPGVYGLFDRCFGPPLLVPEGSEVQLFDGINHDSMHTKWLCDGAETLGECARRLRLFAEDVHAACYRGWTLTDVPDGGRITAGLGVTPASPPEPAAPAVTSPADAVPRNDSDGEGIVIAVKWLFDGAASLAEVAAIAESTAAELDANENAGATLVHPVDNGLITFTQTDRSD